MSQATSIFCSECGAKNNKNLEYCKECGEKLEKIDEKINSKRITCPNCGTTNLDNYKHCLHCGMELDVNSTKPRADDSKDLIEKKVSLEDSKIHQGYISGNTNWSEYLSLEDSKIHQGGLVKRFREHHTSEEHAKEEVSKWETILSPKLEEEYYPSGKTTGLAVLIMAGALIPGAVIGAAACAIIFAVAILLSFLIVMLIAALPCIPCILLIFLLIVFLGGYLIAYFALGYLGGLVIAWLGKKGNNRNIIIPALLAFFAAALGSYLFIELKFMFFITLFPEDVTTTVPSLLDKVSALDFIGIIISLIAGVHSAREEVINSKFCEKCEKFMEKTESPKLDIHYAEKAAEIIDQRDFNNLKKITKKVPDSDTFFQLDIYSCPECEQGFFDATANVKTKWKEKDKDKDHERKWKFRSITITNDQAEIIKEAIRKWRTM